jgi:hypothetical protein
MKPGITIHMGASSFTVEVRTPTDGILHFDLNRMDKHQTRDFTRTLVRAWRETHQ